MNRYLIRWISKSMREYSLKESIIGMVFGMINTVIGLVLFTEYARRKAAKRLREKNVQQENN